MAEGGSSIDTTRESSVDSEVVKLKVKQKDCELTVAQTELSWTIKDQKKNCTFSVRRRDLVAVKTKEDVKNKDSTVLTVVYVKQQKDFVLKRCEESFSGSNSVCLAVAKTLQDGINQCADRPKRLLVLINPISGFSRGEKNYKNICAPIFEEAGIQTDVIVTARAHHTEDILSTYDLSSIDGITLVGGDGLFHEAANGIVRRMAVETGSDINNLEFSPMEFTIPMALIPCGTGNGVAKQFLRNYDISTAVYAIVIGFRYKANICSVCSEGRLLSYSVLLVGYGVWGDIIYAAETKRHMGVLRYPASFLSLLFGRFRTLKIKIDIKAPLEFLERNSATMAYLEQPTASGINSKGKETDVDTPGQDSEPEPKKSDVSENRSNFTSYDGYFTGAIVFVEPLSSFVNMFINPTQEAVTNVTQIYMSKPCRKFKFFKSTFQLLDLNSEIVNKPAEPFLELVFKELKIRLLDPQEATSESGRKELILNIDGEITRLEQPEIHIKMFPQRIPLFCNIPAIVGRY
ncbi:sphingosine kinase A-like isoform X4 [Dreissena polymorpha]|uniref:sphingosine kinase A-like isoform X4 n=1 Tax=Dreissena polymorpha TaxID=45954 RepID=UPI002264D907|nr:sphingosine kinase A-like isoform X4 [Dreissena polymorpha]